MESKTNKKKIINDPVHGFVTLSHNILHDLIEHPYFQRLRRIKQLGLTHLVYPGAMHTRFHHAIGAMFLMDEALKSLQEKKLKITGKEVKAAKAAILLHDIGHGPFSHALEHSIVDQISHEEISLLFMKRLNAQFDGKLTDAIQMFSAEYPKRFLSQLISSQLDVDRLDYLRRDSFYTGVSEGVIGTQRILKMLDVRNDALVVELKGIYSIDNFLNSRRIMYWQVYLHKTVLSAEFTLINILKRARNLTENGVNLFATPALDFFLRNRVNNEDFCASTEPLDIFAQLDDFDIMASVKTWTRHSDPVLSDLCKRITNRNLLKIELSDKPFDLQKIEELKNTIISKMSFPDEWAQYFVFTGITENQSYNFKRDNIQILLKDNSVVDLSEVSDQWKNNQGSLLTRKYYLCYPKDLI
jgi:hypothetical protein